MNTDWKGVILASLWAPILADAQGTFNASNNYTRWGATQKAFVYCGYLEGPMPKQYGRVQILNAADESTLSPGGDAGVALAADGLFFINGLTVPGVPPGGTAHLVVRAWNTNPGPTWATALLRGQAFVTISNLGGPSTPAATFADNSNFAGVDACGGYNGPLSVELSPPIWTGEGRWMIRLHSNYAYYSGFIPGLVRVYSSPDLLEWRPLDVGEIIRPDWIAQYFDFLVPADNPDRFFRVVEVW